MSIELDPEPPTDFPTLEWGDSLLLNWKTREDCTIHILTQREFLTKHRGATIL